MTPAAVVPLLCFASFRVTRLLNLDSILEGPRRRWYRRFPPEHHPLGQLAQCPFCAGFWVSGAMLGVAHLVHLAGWPLKWDLVLWWAVAGGQALISVAEEKLGL